MLTMIKIIDMIENSGLEYLIINVFFWVNCSIKITKILRIHQCMNSGKIYACTNFSHNFDLHYLKSPLINQNQAQQSRTILKLKAQGPTPKI